MVLSDQRVLNTGVLGDMIGMQFWDPSSADRYSMISAC
jgi:hypothetical protein